MKTLGQLDMAEEIAADYAGGLKEVFLDGKAIKLKDAFRSDPDVTALDVGYRIWKPGKAPLVKLSPALAPHRNAGQPSTGKLPTAFIGRKEAANAKTAGETAPLEAQGEEWGGNLPQNGAGTRRDLADFQLRRSQEWFRPGKAAWTSGNLIVEPQNGPLIELGTGGLTVKTAPEAWQEIE